MRIGSREFDTEHQTYIMGILNVTPDSFSDGGKYSRIDAALAHAEEMIREGADIIDVGGESTRPGHVQITDEEEIARVVPVIEALKARFDTPVSVDTYKSAVAREAVKAGADLVNDIWGLKYDPGMAHVIAASGVACCLMHNRDNTDYGQFIPEFLDDMRECVRLADAAGIARDKIILDPGVGFGKTYEMNLEIISRLEVLHELGFPVLLGTSRKSVIGLTLDLPPVERIIRSAGQKAQTAGAGRGRSMDKIKIKDLEVFANHGVFPEENTLGQKFIVSADLYTDTRKAGKTDDLTASIHYGEVSAFIEMWLKKHTYKLLESAAENLAEELLLKYPGMRAIRLEIKKPWAPIRLPLKTVSVEIERAKHTAYIAMGSNMGDREKYIKDAVKLLDSVRGCTVKRVSDLIETPPYGVTDQDDFLNGCLELETLLTPRELLRELNRIEAEAGRERTVHWGPRTLDLDIIFYDDEMIREKDLCIPHVDMHNRRFVLEPLSQIAPYMRHPVYGKTVVEMYETLKR